MEDFSRFIKPDFTVLVAALYCLGIALRRSALFPNNMIPLLLTACGAGLGGLSVAAHYSAYANPAAAFLDALVQGILCAGMAVYINQLIKQSAGNK
ncbi:phage holin family protein [Intestinibacillus massiliensis]|uniref:phage holin family protein n=1 Tax=Intestinibacillus massiliensis TaxID=1871029 RepID=UPI0013565D46|nr:phage holin family protein [Intestinibacillus massiliensis]MCB6366962.1 phage holin family protein [Intestinibacillus massiliensis]